MQRTRGGSSRRIGIRTTLAFLIPIAVGCAGQGERPPEIPPDALPAGTVIGEGTIHGRVVYEGVAPEPEPISMQSDANCQRSHTGTATRETLLVGEEGALRNVFVRVAVGFDGRFAPPEEPVQLDQAGCRYTPHVVGLQVGQPLLVINSDPTLHNVHSVSTANPAFNFGMAVQGQRATRYFGSEEIMIKVKCDVHPWMAAWIGVLWHPFFDITGEDGLFSIEGLPAGTYTLEAWHESLGTARREVVLSEGAREQVAFSFAAGP